MSTRSVIEFVYGDNVKPQARVYHHYDGDPETMARDLGLFFDDVAAQCGPRGNDNCFTDPSYLAAKFIVWQATRYARDPGGYEGAPKGGPMYFSGVAPCIVAPPDIAYLHTVRCPADVTDKAERPTVTSREAFHGED